MAGPAIPIFDPLVAILISLEPYKAAFPAKQYPLVIAILRQVPLKDAQFAKLGTWRPAI